MFAVAPEERGGWRMAEMGDLKTVRGRGEETMCFVAAGKMRLVLAWVVVVALILSPPSPLPFLAG